ncbi:MAG: hypothetical protein BGN97_05965 [Microbacterium sp. 69-10]|uniref:DNA-binding protein n=1 Tax=Microbacterium sp. 69-10 TaxID=1895783 RepID=UPI00095A3A44|nr:DNA-binding protein [Microbacterium sp. 69-10]OJU41892.1 MAG: hypothetical protein BGN97_05965 [Microbacterium sp. 69-10]
MFVLTVDQKSSRTSSDLVPEALAQLRSRDDHGILLGPERTVGDEFQLITAHADKALTLILHLTRGRSWSVGVGIGSVEQPVPASIREARGSAFINAREAVESAKSDPTRLAIVNDAHSDEAQALVRLLIALRDRRTDKGWEIYDALNEHLTQRQAAHQLGITPAAASLRATAAGLRVEEQALPALVGVLNRLNVADSEK